MRLNVTRSYRSDTEAELKQQGTNWTGMTKGQYHGGFHSPTIIPPSALDKPSIMKHYHRQQTCSHTSPRRSPTMVTLDGTRFVECRCWNDGENCRHLTVVGVHDTGHRAAKNRVRWRGAVDGLCSTGSGGCKQVSIQVQVKTANRQ